MTRILLTIISLLLAIQCYAADTVSFLALSDIHFDPFIACKNTSTRPCPLAKRLQSAPVREWHRILEGDGAKTAYRQDTNFLLLQTSLSEAKLAITHHPVSFILVLGDTLGHDFHYYYKKYVKDSTRSGYANFVAKTLEYVNSELAAAFPAQNVFMVVGNNDTFSHNYQSVPSGPFFTQMASNWSSLIKDTKARTTMQREFATAGYYAVDIPNHPEMKLIALNTVLFSSKSKSGASLVAAGQQLQWLHQVLTQAKANHQKVIIAMHIPPALDLYLVNRWQLLSFTTFWRPDFVARFKGELANFYPQIAGVFTGHLHYEWSQPLWVSAEQRIPVITVPSISPIFGNDPSFKVYEAQGVYTYTYPVYGHNKWFEDFVRDFI